KQQWGFTDFYFISKDGNYLTADGREGYLDFQHHLSDLILEDACVVADATLPGSPELMVFAVPIAPGTFRGFDYEPIAISYDNQDIIASLEISAFDGQSASYVVYSDGRVLLNNGNKAGHSVYNVFSWLEKDNKISGQQLQKLQEQFRQRGSGVITFRTAGEAYYLVYEPVNFQDWMVLGIVPARVVNASMNRLQTVTMLVVIGIAGLICITLVAFLAYRNHERLVSKDAELLYREELFGTLSANVDDVFIMMDTKQLKPDYISPNIEKLLGIAEKEVRADINVLNRLIRETGTASMLDRLPGIALGERQQWEREYIHQGTGEVRWFRVTAYRTRIHKAEKYVLVLSDRTREQQMNQSLANALEVARSANAAKSNFLANMSHDIRTPMNAIVGFATLLGRDADQPDKVREYTRKIAFSSQHLLGLINDILDMSKIESGHTALNVTAFNMMELMEAVYTIVLPQTRAKNQTLDLRARGNLPERVQGDKIRLSQILLNLLSNAVKYTKEGGTISLMVEGLERKIRNHVPLRFVVADNGVGMSEQFLKNIFDMFAREDTEHNREIQGTGLGMAITKNIVDLMGGTICVQSTLGQGSTFTVELELPVADGEPDDNFWRRHGITRLLAADDEEEACHNIRQLMAEAGVQVCCATSGAQAVELALQAHDRNEGFDIILLDWEMPGMDGVEAARRIRAKVGPGVPILVLAACDFTGIEETARQAGVDMLMQKPFFLPGFQRMVAQYYEEKSTDQMPAKAQEYSLAGLHVLVVEDNAINAEIMSRLLQMEQAICEVVPNGQAAVERFLRSAPGEFDMIFMDIQMPVMDGYEATRRIRACGHPDAAHIAIIAMTANAFEEDVKKALEAGMNAHAAKPVDMEKLKQTLSGLMGKAGGGG
nr:response regulator [bacterium]